MNKVSYAQQQIEAVALETRQIAFSTGNIFVMNADGSNVCRLTYSDDSEDSHVWSPDGTQIAFSSRYRGVFVMNADGSNLRRLGPGGNPIWSPDGTKIAFLDYQNRTYGSYIVAADGTNLHKFANSIFQTWALASNQAYFTSNRDGNEEIYLANIDGSGEQNLTNDPSDDRWQWQNRSPDGKNIYFVSNREGRFAIYRMNADGTNTVKLTDQPDADVFVRGVSSDGNQLAFVEDVDSKQNFDSQLYLVATDGSSMRQLTDFPHSNIGQVYWSPDGSHIAFEVTSLIRRNGNQFTTNSDIYVMKSDGTDLRLLTDYKGDLSYDGTRTRFSRFSQGASYVWSSDGSQIVFESGRDQHFGIYIMNADGSNVRELIPNAVGAAWSPIGTPARALMATISSPNKINVRSTPSAKSAVVDSIAPVRNRCMVVLGRNEDNSWVKIRNPFSKVEIGWVNASLLEVRGDLLSVPILDE